MNGYRTVFVALTILCAGLAVWLLSGCISCRPKAVPENFTYISNSLRLSGRTIDFAPTGEVVRVAVKEGRLPAELVFHGFDVEFGSITIVGKDGKIVIESGNKIRVVKEGHEEREYELAHQFIVLNLLPGKYADQAQVMRFQRSLTPDDISNLKASLGKEKMWQISPELKAEHSGKTWLIEIPLMVGEDFSGTVGTLTLQSNWYDF